MARTTAMMGFHLRGDIGDADFVFGGQQNLGSGLFR